MSKKKLVFWKKLIGDPVIDGFSQNPEYHAFFNLCNETFDFRFAYGRESYLGNGVFANVLVYKDGLMIETNEQFSAEAIYQFKGVADESFDNAVPIVNTPQFKRWCGDKWNQYLLLKDFMPKTFLIEREEELVRGVSEITTSKAVIKPRRGQRGEDVCVFSTSKPPKLDSKILEEKGYLLQEFSDTGVGIPNVALGIHDIKLVTIDDSVFASLRIPEVEGKEFCTFDSPYSEVDIKNLPNEVLAFHKAAKEKINEEYPGQLYTIDIGVTKEGPVIFELNGHTAFPYIHFSHAQDFFRALINHLQAI